MGSVRHTGTMKRSMAFGVAAAMAIGGIALAGGPAASEAFPGANGNIAFVRDNGDDTADIWVTNLEATDQIQLTDSPGWDDSPAWSPDGTKIAFQREDGNDTQVWVMDADGSNEVRLTDDAVGAGAPAWSPDSTRIVYNGWGQTGSGPALFIMNADGSGVTQLTTDNDFDRWPSWSPDGATIAFGRDDPQTSAIEIWTIGVDGTGLTQRTDSGVASIQSFEPSWSPDGSQILFTRRNGNDYFAYLMQADGTDQHQLLGPGTSAAEFSPDGATIALGYFPGADDGLWTMSPDGSNASPFLTGDVFQPTWQRLPNPVNPTTTVPSTSTTAANAAVVTPAFTG